MTPKFIRIIFNGNAIEGGTDIPWDDFIWLINNKCSYKPGHWPEEKLQEMRDKYG